MAHSWIYSAEIRHTSFKVIGGSVLLRRKVDQDITNVIVDHKTLSGVVKGLSDCVSGLEFRLTTISTSYEAKRETSRVIPYNGPLARYIKLRVAHAPGMPDTFSLPPRVSDPDMHHGTCVTHVPWCMPGSLTSGFPWSQRRGKRSRHPRSMRNPQFYVSGKRPIGGKCILFKKGGRSKYAIFCSEYNSTIAMTKC